MRIRVRNYAAQRQKLKMKDKQDCTELLAKILDRTSKWRRKTAAKFPDDPRNLALSLMLGQLAADSVNISDAQWETLRPYCGGWDSQIFHDGVTLSIK